MYIKRYFQCFDLIFSNLNERSLNWNTNSTRQLTVSASLDFPVGNFFNAKYIECRDTVCRCFEKGLKIKHPVDFLGTFSGLLSQKGVALSSTIAFKNHFLVILYQAILMPFD